MSLKLVFVLIGLAWLFGISLGYFMRWLVALGKRGSLELEIRQKLLEANEEAARIIAKSEEEAKTEEADVLADVRAREERLNEAEERVSRREENLEKEETRVEAREKSVANKREDLLNALEGISEMDKEEARELLLNNMTAEYDEVLARRIKKIEFDSKEEIDQEARKIIAKTIERIAPKTVEELTTFTINLKDDSTKGRIIGRDGRNIRAFERAAGVDVIIDEAPKQVTISSFDPLRRHIAREAMLSLIEDGRIQPAKIEEFVERERARAQEQIEERGKEAVMEAGVVGLPDGLVKILGRLYFRTSYGQNVLNHSIEMAHIASALADELGADPAIARAGALLHDIGKAVDHEVSGTHVEIGKRILEKFDIDKRVVLAMQSHHDEYPKETLEAVIVGVADTLSARRPGARQDTVENYLKRMEDLEAIADKFDGVQKSFVLDGGREIRVFVETEKVGDNEVQELARNIAREIQKDLMFPGEIKVNVIREKRVVEYAR